MLPDFPDFKKKVQEQLSRELLSIARQEPMLAQIREDAVFEGEGVFVSGEDGYEDKQANKEVGGQVEFNIADVIERGEEAIKDAVTQMAAQLSEAKGKEVVSRIEEVTTKSGNVIDGKGKPFFDAMIESLEKVRIDFDDDSGEPLMPTMFIHPDMGKKLREQIAVWEADPEYKKRYDQMMAKKRREYDDRESHRKLVD